MLIVVDEVACCLHSLGNSVCIDWLIVIVPLSDVSGPRTLFTCLTTTATSRLWLLRLDVIEDLELWQSLT